MRLACTTICCSTLLMKIYYKLNGENAMSRCSTARILSATLVVGLNFAGSLFANPPKEIFAPVEKVMMASGFDDNDNVQISIYGNFPDTCYRVGPTGYTVDHESRKIQIWAKAYDYSSREIFCREVLVPFLLDISVGVLSEGDYTVEIVNSNIRDTVKIGKSVGDAPDEFLYAPVSQTRISDLPKEGKHEVTISGHFPKLIKGCMILKDVRHYRSPSNVLVVLPIADIVEDDSLCSSTTKEHFEYKFKIDTFNDVGLLHVRSMNGSSKTELISKFNSLSVF